MSQRPGAKSGDTQREDAPDSNSSAPAPSPAGAPICPCVTICGQCGHYISGQREVLDTFIPGSVVSYALCGGCSQPSTLDSRLSTTPVLVELCMMCGDVKEGDHWRPLGDYEGETLRTDLNVHVTHGICPHCSGDFKAQRRRLQLDQIRKQLA